MRICCMQSVQSSAPSRNLDGSTVYRGMRITALFLCLLVEGGWPIVPRTIILVLAAALVFILSSSTPIQRRIVPLFTIPFIVLLVTMARPNFDALSAGARFVNFCVAIFLLNIYMRPRPTTTAPLTVLEGDLSFLLKLMCYQAIATFLLGYAVPGLFKNVPVGDYIYQSAFYVLNYHMMYLDTTIRPDGFFYERGVFQLYLNLYLYIALFRKKSWLQAGLALAAIMTTWSTTGLVTAFAILVIYAVGQLKRIDPVKIVIAAILTAAVVLPFGIFMMGNLERKLYGEESGSYLVRQSDINAGFGVLWEAPILGIGFDDDELTQRMGSYITFISGIDMSDMQKRTISNGLLRMAIAIGLPLALLHLFGLARQALFPHRAPILVMVLFTLISESIPFNPFLLCIMYSGLVGSQVQKRAGSFVRNRGASVVQDNERILLTNMHARGGPRRRGNVISVNGTGGLG
jgi:hypothetical protein